VLEHLEAIEIPETYAELIGVAREAFATYHAFIIFVGDIEGFEA